MQSIRTQFVLLLALSTLVLAGCDASDERAVSVVEGGAQTRMVMFTADYCPACREMKPLIETLNHQCRHHGVEIDTIDVSEQVNEQVVDEYRVVGVPTFLFVDETGIEVARLTGRQTPQSLKQAMSAVRGAACPGLSKIDR
jgi:thiol-disulfide isomerase/thioredoxin